MPSVVGLGTTLPEFQYSPGEVRAVGEGWLSGDSARLALFERFIASSGAEGRRFVLPPTELLELGGMKMRAELFEKYAAPMGAQALATACRMAEVETDALTSIVFTSCTCPSIPAVDGIIVDLLRLPRSIRRVPIYQHGCAGGVVGLGLAAELSRLRGPVALTSVELCSLLFHIEDQQSSQLVGASIFADGAASLVIVPEERGLAVRGSQSSLLPNTRHLMGYDIHDNGMHLRLDRALPQALVEAAPERLTKFLSDNEVHANDIRYWLFHPGGAKILDLLEDKLTLDPRQARWSREVLQSVGNMSSATVLFVLQRFLDAQVCALGDKIVMMGVGPGLTLEFILFEWLGTPR